MITRLAGAAAALTLLAACSGTSEPAPAPVPQASPTATVPSAADVVGHGYPTGMAADGHSDVMTVWQWCGHGYRHCWHAWRIVQRDGRVALGDAEHGLAPTAFGSTDGFVVRRWDRPGEVVAPDGTTTPLVAGAAAAPRAGDVVVSARRDLALADPDRAVEWPIPHPTGVDGWAVGTVSSTGTLWLLPHGAGPGPVEVRRTTDGRHWARTAISTDREGGDVPGYIVTAGDRVAVLATFDGATILPLGTLAVTTDGGRHWTRLSPDDLPFDTVGEMTASRDGTLFVTSAEGERLYRSTDASWTRFARVPRGGWVAFLTPVPDGVLALQHRRPVVFGDDGQRRSAPDLR